MSSFARTSDYHGVLRSFGFNPTVEGIWLEVVTQALRVSGWKLHISGTPSSASALLQAVLPVLKPGHVAFKVARDEKTLAELNRGEWGTPQVGKFITVYPVSDDVARSLAEQLRLVTQDFSGPLILTDIRIGAVLYARYGAFLRLRARDRLGAFKRLMELPDGSIVPDQYSVPFEPAKISSELFNPFENMAIDCGIAPDSKAILEDRYVLVHNMLPRGRGSVYLGIDTQDSRKPQLVAIKEARRGCLPDRLGRDAVYNLRREASILGELYGVICAPRIQHSFEALGNFYLVLEYVPGGDFCFGIRPWRTAAKAERQSALTRLFALASTVEGLHRAGYVHRDLKPANVIIGTDGRLTLIDFESACLVDDESVPVMGGTIGYMAPETASVSRAAFPADVYSLGAIMVALLGGFSPDVITRNAECARREKLLGLTEVTSALADLALSCLATSTVERPTAGEVVSILGRCIRDHRNANSSPGYTITHQSGANRDAILRLRDRAVRALTSGVPRDAQTGLWLSYAVTYGSSMVNTGLFRSAHRGVAGVVLLAAKLKLAGSSGIELERCVAPAIDWLLEHHSTDDDQMPGLHFGEAGVAVAIAEAIRAGLVAEGAWTEPYLQDALSAAPDWPDYTHGAAGQGVAALRCAQLGWGSAAAAAHKYAQYLVGIQLNDGSWELPSGPEQMGGVRYTGFAHGVAGIVYFLAAYSAQFRDEISTADAARRGAEWLVQMAIPKSSLERGSVGEPLWWRIDADTGPVDLKWCHGSPGIALTFLKLWEAFRDSTYANTARRALMAIPRRYGAGSPIQCCGLSGIGEIYLDAARVLGDEVWLDRALEIGELLGYYAQEDSGGATWLTTPAEWGSLPSTADLMVGSGGVTHFISRLCFPDVGAPLLLGPA